MSNFIMDEFSSYGRTNKPVNYQLIKKGQGNFVIRRNGRAETMHSLKWVAEERFNKLKKAFGVTNSPTL